MTAPGPEDHPDARVLDHLNRVVVGRKGADPDTSYTAKLFAKGPKKITQKVGEEATEVVIAALVEGPEAVVTESADLLYHLSVLWAQTGVAPDQVWAELARRFGTSGLEEKASRTP
ncbi:phosphoribosyl-ATP diphosphatase [Roseospira marina]|uniref:Phosphoribosyl-ATP pyrophosphatase n=1 Tax=Roseospira marina TaxID=140057 RepID=A0A5M6I6J8_9PROT|nr:phosphoribosyl-ATP diphosphatase [Roseospira marina]KAA5603871.1 phosphoribosyl-ATP diphosphatase [Roseospira marina]MBB4313735.1 phosphoribosyl-ATP pyrophosphohydrolase [Roseospira marina]MBB5086897.1 phosphoribosyl-ATP pyrophosphohydrolase [Roseospira marina]